MAIRFLTGIQVDGVVASPASASAAVVSDTIEVSFTQSTSSVDQYQVWAAQGSGSFDLIATIPYEDFSSTMTVVDTSFSTSGTRNYRVYAIQTGNYSASRTASASFTVSSLDVTNLSVTPMEEAFVLNWNNPVSRFVDHIEVYHHTHATSSSLSRSSASIVYSGSNSTHTQIISDDNFHQFWVEVSTS
mgnify:FL=1|tara:strand:- start:989 stop:1552 length:564 start_codon:yes stop_codon:yes gene_type:complete